MSSTKFLILALATLNVALAFPQPPLKLANSTEDFFWYVNDNGQAVPAIMNGGPPPATLAVAEEKVEFWLYKNGREPGVLIRPDCDSCLQNYVKDAPLVVLSHGFSSNHEGDFGKTHRDALSQRPEDINVIFVDWGKLAVAPWYETAANNVNPVGTYTARLINFLCSKGVATLDKVHFVGHSLGSHVGNYVGRNVVGQKIGRITALDPALPLFGRLDDSGRIDPSDAEFVDVIHTAMGYLPSGLAFMEPRGHVDFYPNSGKNQPGCGLDLFGACSHGRANSFFAESVVNPRAFVGCKCSDWEEFDKGRCLCTEHEPMGWATPSSARGLYYLRTNANSPFGQG